MLKQEKVTFHHDENQVTSCDLVFVMMERFFFFLLAFSGHIVLLGPARTALHECLEVLALEPLSLNPLLCSRCLPCAVRPPAHQVFFFSPSSTWKSDSCSSSTSWRCTPKRTSRQVTRCVSTAALKASQRNGSDATTTANAGKRQGEKQWALDQCDTD